jgi:hypothetical protein
MVMEASIVVAGVPRLAGAEENARRVDAAFAAFQGRYPGALTENSRVEPAGGSSQTLSFRVTAPDLRSAQAMLAFFEEQLVRHGFAPRHRGRVTLAGAKGLWRRFADAVTRRYAMRRRARSTKAGSI